MQVDLDIIGMWLLFSTVTTTPLGMQWIYATLEVVYAMVNRSSDGCRAKSDLATALRARSEENSCKLYYRSMLYL